MWRWLSVAMLLAGSVGSVSVAEASTGCAATPVRGSTVDAGPFSGGISRPYDVLHGRFRLRPGAFRDRATGLSQKIPWFVSRRFAVGKRLTIVGRRLGRHHGRFVMRLLRTSGVGDRQRWVFPSIVAPPRSGCWRLRLSSGQVRGRLTVLVKPA